MWTQAAANAGLDLGGAEDDGSWGGAFGPGPAGSGANGASDYTPVSDTRRGGATAPFNPFGVFIPGSPENEAWTQGVERMLGLRGQPGGPVQGDPGGGTDVQEMATPAPAPPQTDSLGRVISPRANMPPPGDCTPGQHRRLQSDVETACKGAPRTCTGEMTMSELETNLQRNMACGNARDRINGQCFAGGNMTHRQASIDAWNAVQKCTTLMHP